MGTFPPARFGLFPSSRVLDSGRDAPLDERGLKIWHLTLIGTLVFGAVVLSVSFLTFLHH